MIKASPTAAEAKVSLMENAWEPGTVSEMLGRAGAQLSRPEELGSDFGLTEQGYRMSEAQAQAILDMRLNRLTGLEKDKIFNEYKDLLARIEDLLQILSNPERLMLVIREELENIREMYGDDRRTEIVSSQQDLQIEDLIEDEAMVVTLSHAGYVKSQPLSIYSAQRRGGKGKAAASTKDEDFIDKLFIANAHDTLLCFSSRGKLYWIKVYELPVASRISRGRPIVNLLPLEEGERINTVLPIREYSEDEFVFMATSNGTVKKTPLKDFSRPRASGIIAIELREDNYLIGVDITNGESDVMLVSNSGKAIRFNEETVRAMGRTAAGVRGMKLAAGQRVISLIIMNEGMVLTATKNGYGKRTPVDDFPTHGRGGQGVIAIQTSERNGEVVSAVLVNGDDEIMLISDGGTLVRTRTSEISVVGRNAQGVRLINLSHSEHLVGVDRICDLEEADDVSGDEATTASPEQ
jgi:DNA gyrase subunit A